jgi:glutamate synthase (NADPH/NADH) large chain
VRSAEALDVHAIAVTIGVGATSINPYLAQESIADRQRRGLFGEIAARGGGALSQGGGQGLLKMSKMGISIMSAYRGGYNFEAIGLSRALTAEFFPGMPSRISGIGLSGIASNVLSFHGPPGPDGDRAAGGRPVRCAAMARSTPSTAT